MDQEELVQGPLAYITLPGEKIKINLLTSMYQTSRVRTSKHDFDILIDTTNAENTHLQSKHTGWVWKQEIQSDQQLKVALFNNPFQYFPEKNDFVVALVQRKTLDNYFCSIGSGSQFILSSLDFEGATKKNRPNIQVGSLIYARVVEANSLLRGKISCINPKSKKEWVTGESLFGELKEGLCIDVSLNFTEQLLAKQKKPELFKSLSKYCSFEVSVGKNGKIWFKAEKEEHSTLIYNLLKKAQSLKEEEQKFLVQQYQELFK